MKVNSLSTLPLCGVLGLVHTFAFLYSIRNMLPALFPRSSSGPSLCFSVLATSSSRGNIKSCNVYTQQQWYKFNHSTFVMPWMLFKHSDIHTSVRSAGGWLLTKISTKSSTLKEIFILLVLCNYIQMSMYLSTVQIWQRKVNAADTCICPILTWIWRPEAASCFLWPQPPLFFSCSWILVPRLHQI